MPRAPKTLSTIERNVDMLLPWSYSKLAEYWKCPRKAFYRYVEKLPEEKSDALERGNRVHAELEAWARGGFKKLSPAWKTFEREAHRIELPQQSGVIVEEMWRFDINMKPVERGPDEWLRVKCDLAVPDLSLIVDHKTGKRYPDHRAQGEVYGVGFLSKFDVPAVQVEFWYVDLGEVSEMEVRRSDVPRIVAALKISVRDMVEDVDFTPKPSRLCDWCSFARTRGGPCEAG